MSPRAKGTHNALTVYNVLISRTRKLGLKRQYYLYELGGHDLPVTNRIDGLARWLLGPFAAEIGCNALLSAAFTNPLCKDDTHTI
ncbi:hypothetical protein MJO29_013256 [Puccinia striiformis f. sp. tritici]|nr:hypothetical protein MJO29_013256 [Puccinia striiformis f. sp. tritici]